MSDSAPIAFKSRKNKNLRQRRRSSADEDNEECAADVLSKLEETKQKQKLREKPRGVNIIGLAIGQKVTIEDGLSKDDPFKAKSGGMVNMQTLKAGKVNQVEDPYDVGIGTQFSAETNKRDEDEEMMKYIEDELSKRKNKRQAEENDDDEGGFAADRYMSPEDAALMSLPDHLRQSSTQRSEEMLSNQMLNGIPEVDLGIDAKIRNIEATESAKEKLLMDHRNRKDGPSKFVPTNVAVNFVQHNRFNIEDPEVRRQRQQQIEAKRAARNEGNARPGGERAVAGKRATDDYHYDKFRKQFRR